MAKQQYPSRKPTQADIDKMNAKGGPNNPNEARAARTNAYVDRRTKDAVGVKKTGSTPRTLGADFAAAGKKKRGY